MTNQEYIFSLLKENESQPVAFYTSQYDYSGNTNIKSIFDESVAKAGQINGGYEHHSALRALAKKVAGVRVIDKGWRFMILKYERAGQ
jgi:hypothetical protein